MSDCITCLSSMTAEEILRATIVCDENGNKAFRLVLVSYTEDCLDCEQYETIDDIVRSMAYCDEEGKVYLKATLLEIPT